MDGGEYGGARCCCSVFAPINRLGFGCSTRPPRLDGRCFTAKDYEEIRLLLAEPRIAVVIVPAPGSEVELEELERIVRAGPDVAYRDEEWEKYRSTHEPPAKLRSSHPPEYGA